ncbi:MAG: hypothetical protein GEU88_03710 [Solirubrobacterales bacterium]|nr:hypothetical protein [Solirubrobacterales bacterium]
MGIRDLFKLTREARELRHNTPTPSMGGMLGRVRETVADLNAQRADSSRLLAEGIPGTAVIRDMGTPARGAAWFSLMLDLEVHPRTREPYRVANQYLVPARARLEPGVELPVRIDADDPSRIAIDWDRAPQGPQPGEIRPL